MSTRFLWFFPKPVYNFARAAAKNKHFGFGIINLMSDYGPDLFAGTAEFYASYRPAYPAKMFDDIVNHFGLNGQGGLLDLGCGTGELAIPLAQYFYNVVGVDPDSAMIRQAKLKSAPAAVSNIEWRIGSSKDLKTIEKPIKLAVLGQSLHWMDEKTVINQLHDLLEPRGGLFIVGGGGISAINSKDQNLQPKDLAIKRLVLKYLGGQRRAGSTIYKPADLNWEQDLFPNSKFEKFEKRIYQTKVVRNIDQELGNLYSMSWARREYFGSNINKFEAEFRRDLTAINSRGRFINVVSFEAFFLNK